MTGAVVQIVASAGQVWRAFGQFAALMGNTTPIMRATGTCLLESTHTRFESAVSPG